MASRKDWKLCKICQESTKEPLKCPLNSHGTGDKSKAYENFLTSVSEFRELNKLPVAIVFGEDMDTISRQPIKLSGTNLATSNLMTVNYKEQKKRA